MAFFPSLARPNEQSAPDPSDTKVTAPREPSIHAVVDGPRPGPHVVKVLATCLRGKRKQQFGSRHSALISPSALPPSFAFNNGKHQQQDCHVLMQHSEHMSVTSHINMTTARRCQTKFDFDDAFRGPTSPPKTSAAIGVRRSAGVARL